MMIAPIVIFVYNRAERIKRLIESLSINPECSESSLFIFSDGAKNSNDATKVDEVRNYIRTIESLGVFRSVEIVESQTNQGLANSIIQGVSQIMDRFGRAIVIEDDNIVAPDYLDYMNRALDFYENDQTIWCVGGFSRTMSFPEDYKHDVYVMQRTSSYTWGSWKDRWEKIEWDSSKYYPRFLFDRKDRKGFECCGSDRALMLDAQTCRNRNSWAIRFEYSMYKHGMYSILPCISRAECNGNDGSGTHSKKATVGFETIMSDGSRSAVFEHLKMDERIRHEFCRAYRKSIIRKLFGNIDYIFYYFIHKR